MDPVKAFDRFERSGGGFAVPILLFCVGMAITVAACLAIRHLDERVEQQKRERHEEAQQDTMVEFLGAPSHVDV